MPIQSREERKERRQEKTFIILDGESKMTNMCVPDGLRASLERLGRRGWNNRAAKPGRA